MARHIIAFGLVGALACGMYWLLPGSKLAKSDADILLGVRTFDASVQTNRLVFAGAALTWAEGQTPKTYVPYHFAFDGTQFTEVPDSSRITTFQRDLGVDVEVASGVELESCVDPRPDSIATGAGLSLIFPTLCRIKPSSATGPDGIIGVIFPADRDDLDLDADAVCRTETAHWLTQDGFSDPTIVFCAIVDRPVGLDDFPQIWMDVILYQHVDGNLYTLRAESRNFQRIN